MAVPLETLTSNDYAILDYVNKFESISKEQILKKFKNKIEALDYRLTLLAKKDYSSFARSFVPDSSYIVEEFEDAKNESGLFYSKSTGKFHISPLGRKALQDYRVKKKSDLNFLWLKNAWIPIIVAFVTTLLTNYIVPKLPSMIKWLSNFLSKIA